MASEKSKDKKSASGAGVLLWQTSNAWQRFLRNKLKSIDLTYVQFLLLQETKRLQDIKVAPTQIVLSRAAGTDVMMTSKVIRTLVKEKLVVRKSKSGDGRAFTLQLTTEGKKKTGVATAVYAAAESEFFSRLVSKPHKFILNLKSLSSEDSTSNAE
jgi:DNA-binding MarR family transcriptional regulator